MTIWFSTLYPVERDIDFVSLAGCKLSQEIRDVIDIPSAPQWEALNKAFQLNQGAPPCTKPQDRLCANPNCGVAEKDTVKRQFYRGGSDWNMLIRNAWVCQACYNYASRTINHGDRVRYGELRPRGVCMRESRVCANPHCGAKAPDVRTWRFGKPNWHPLVRNVHICFNCWRWMEDNPSGQLRVPKNVGAGIPMEDRVCANPNCRATSLTISRRKWHIQGDQYLCSACYQHTCKYPGTNRSLEQVQKARNRGAKHSGNPRPVRAADLPRRKSSRQGKK
jgi:hypothetical protein